MRRDVFVIYGELFSEEASVELEVHGEKILKRSKQFFPDLNSGQNFGMHTFIYILVHEDA